MKYAWFAVSHDGKYGLNTKQDGSGQWFTRGDSDAPYTYRNQNDAVKAASRMNRTFKQLGLYRGGFKLSHNNTPVITGDNNAILNRVEAILAEDSDAVNITIERE